MLKDGIGASVVGLCLFIGPPAIVWFIALVIVDSIYGMPIWAIAHIGQEVSEVIPSGANLDTSAAVLSVCAVFTVDAALTHSFPDAVGARFVSLTVLSK